MRPSLHRKQASLAAVVDHSRGCMNHRDGVKHLHTSQRLMTPVCDLKVLALWPAPAVVEVALFQERRRGSQKTGADLGTPGSQLEANAIQCQLRAQMQQQRLDHQRSKLSP